MVFGGNECLLLLLFDGYSCQFNYIDRNSNTCECMISFTIFKRCHFNNRARKSRTTLQNKVRLKILPEQLTLFVNTSVAFKNCIIQ